MQNKGQTNTGDMRGVQPLISLGKEKSPFVNEYALLLRTFTFAAACTVHAFLLLVLSFTSRNHGRDLNEVLLCSASTSAGCWKPCVRARAGAVSQHGC